MSNRRRTRPVRPDWSFVTTHSDCSCVDRRVVPVDELVVCPACGSRAQLPPVIPTEAPIGATMTIWWYCSCGEMTEELAYDVRVVR